MRVRTALGERSGNRVQAGAGCADGVRRSGEGSVRAWVCLQRGRPVLEAVCTCDEDENNNLLGAFQVLI